MRILFLGETYRADAKTWIEGIKSTSGYEIETYELPKNGSRISRIIAFASKWISMFFNRGPVYDIVLAERSTSYGFLALFQRTKLRVVAQQGATDLFPNTFLSKLYKGWIQKLVYQKSDLIHAWGQTMYQHMGSIGVDQSKIILGPKGIDLSAFQYEPFQSKPIKPVHIIVTRSLEWYYRHDLILHAVSKLKALDYDFKLHIVGDGSQRQSLEQLSNVLGLGHFVIFHGRLKQFDLAELLKKSRIYISAPNTEGYSSSLMEAMACGCIPIVTDLPSNRENIIHGVNGFLFENGNVGDLHRCLHDVLKSQINWNAVSEENRQKAEKYFDSTNNMAKFWETYTRKLMELNPSNY
jgi:glycosyltransferase involved in cell wall biosynthesis